jgi:hypothetical protein
MRKTAFSHRQPQRAPMALAVRARAVPIPARRAKRRASRAVSRRARKGAMDAGRMERPQPAAERISLAREAPAPPSARALRTPTAAAPPPYAPAPQPMRRAGAIPKVATTRRRRFPAQRMHPVRVAPAFSITA